jgi:hypothetical protein
MSSRELRPQPLAGLQLHRLDQSPAVAPLAPGEPSQRTFRLIYSDRGRPKGTRNQPAPEFEVTGAQRIDGRVFS